MLLVYNKTAAPFPLAAGNPAAPTLLASTVAGQRGQTAHNVTSYLRPNLAVDPAHGVAGGLSAADFTALEAQRLAGNIDFEWTTDIEYLTGTMIVDAADLAPRPNLPIVMDVTGNDANPGNSTLPVRTLAGVAKVLQAKVGVAGQGQFWLQVVSSGDYDHTAGGNLQLHLPPNIGSATPFFITGPTVDVLGVQTALAGSTKQVINVASLGGILRNTTTASIIAGAPAGQVRISGVVGYVAADVGKQIHTSGCNTAGNNLRFGQIAAVGVGTIDVINAQGVAGDANNGAITVIDSLAFMTLKITSGALAGKLATVFDNTLTTITLNGPFASAPVAGVTFQVFRSGANVKGPIIFHQYSDTRFATANMKFTPGTGNVLNLEGNINWQMQSVEADIAGTPNGGGLVLRNSAHIESGTIGGAYAGEAVNPFDPNNNALAGISVHNGTVLVTNQQCFFPHFSAVLGHSTFTGQKSQSVMQAGTSSFRTTWSWTAGCSVNLAGSGDAAFPSIFDGQLTTSATTGVLNLTECQVAAMQNIQVNNSGGHGVLADVGAQVIANGVVSGTGNAGVGFKANNGANVNVQATNTITGTLGDMQCGSRPVRTWADFYAAAPASTLPSKNEHDVPAFFARPFKLAFAGLVAADSFDITTLAAFATPAGATAATSSTWAGTPPPIQNSNTLRVVTGTAGFLGTYVLTDTGGTAITAGGNLVAGVAKLSDDGKTITFPAGTLATAFTIEYIPVYALTTGARIYQ